MQYISRWNPSPVLCEHGAVNSLYARARTRARWGHLWSALTGRSDHLLALAEIEAVGPLHARRHAGMQTVPIRHIRGSRGRVHDFDRDFYPLKDHIKDRWLRVAGARQRGRYLPPVDLIRVGEVYFVQDGHHRISVARARGQQDIEAEVTVWQVTGPLPWETGRKSSAHGAKDQRIGGECVLGWLQRNGARFVERTLLSVHQLAGAVRMTLRGLLVRRLGVDRL